MATQPEIEAAAWYFCPHIPMLSKAGPNNVCGRTCGGCRIRAAAALEAAENIRLQERQTQLKAAVEAREISS